MKLGYPVKVLISGALVTNANTKNPCNSLINMAHPNNWPYRQGFQAIYNIAPQVTLGLMANQMYPQLTQTTKTFYELPEGLNLPDKGKGPIHKDNYFHLKELLLLSIAFFAGQSCMNLCSQVMKRGNETMQIIKELNSDNSQSHKDTMIENLIEKVILEVNSDFIHGLTPEKRSSYLKSMRESFTQELQDKLTKNGNPVESKITLLAVIRLTLLITGAGTIVGQTYTGDLAAFAIATSVGAVIIEALGMATNTSMEYQDLLKEMINKANHEAQNSEEPNHGVQNLQQPQNDLYLEIQSPNTGRRSKN